MVINYFRVCHCSDLGSTIRCIRENLSDFFSSFGVLLFLYSVVLTKVRNDIYPFTLLVLVFTITHDIHVHVQLN